ncbi:FG-GAP-like repeat-containing protein [Daejeonella lutea]|uniref:FG-GAP-like repeat-containing protein n=1 Tax=Daejeonella lutea TaxID=572036 RepID=UPI001482C2BC|nr:FG-GAP-like repeat-containing protein [Daejeonella lutea]
MATVAIAQPKITGFAPNRGPAGINVTLVGNFNAVLTNNIVYFGAVRGRVIGGSLSTLLVNVPPGVSHEAVSVLDIATGLTGFARHPFVMNYNGTSSLTPASFPSRNDFAAQNNITGIAIADLNNDPKPDIITANGSSLNISVLQNASSVGSVKFNTHIDFPISSSGILGAIALADFDGDGRKDVVVANVSQNKIIVLKNVTTSQGPVNFTNKIEFETGNEPHSIATADFDLDGKIDIAVSNTKSGTISVYRNISSPQAIDFASKVDAQSGGNVKGISLTDVDADGRVDIVAANQLPSGISVIRNIGNSNIGFALRFDFPGGSQLEDIAAGDMNGDDQIDVVSTSKGNPVNNVTIFRNTNNVKLMSFLPGPDLSTNASAIGVDLADLNGDSYVDIGIANNSSNSISLFSNIGTGGNMVFEPPVNYAAGQNPGPIAMCDFDLDGKTDIAVANSGSNLVSVYLNENSPCPTKATLGGSECIGGKLSVSSSQPPTAISWLLNGQTIAGQQGADHTILKTGSYTAVVTFAGGCSVTTNPVWIGENKAEVKLTVNSAALCSSTTSVFNVSAAGASAATIYQWKINGVNSGVLTTSVTFSPTGLKVGDQVSVEAFVANACGTIFPAASNVITMTPPSLEAPAIIIRTDNTEVCTGANVIFTLLATYAGSAPSYQWMRNGVAIPGATAGILNISQLADGDRISCDVTSNDPCQAITQAKSNEIKIAIMSTPAPEITIMSNAKLVYNGAAVTFTASTQNAGPQPEYEWLVNGIKSGTNAPVFVTRELQEGDVVECRLLSNLNLACKGIETVLSNAIAISITDITTVEPPSAFSPNGDAVNDTWEIPGISAFPESRIKVFNRYGSEVYNSVGYEKPWTGEYNGAVIPVGVYYYWIVLGNGTTVKGNVTVLR